MYSFINEGMCFTYRLQIVMHLVSISMLALPSTRYNQYAGGAPTNPTTGVTLDNGLTYMPMHLVGQRTHSKDL